MMEWSVHCLLFIKLVRLNQEMKSESDEIIEPAAAMAASLSATLEMYIIEETYELVQWTTVTNDHQMLTFQLL